MKIGILTYWWASDNYGQILQCYALQKYLRTLGHDAFLIQYNYNNEGFRFYTPGWKRALRALNPIIFFKHFEKKINCKKELELNKERKFDDFRDKYIVMSEQKYMHYTDLRNLPPKADVYIVGSDQVWNFSFIDFNQVKPVVHAYLLDFGDKEVKRVSYAASWGVSAISEELKNEITPLLKNFNYVSVREEKGLDLCKQCGREYAEWVCDPTLLLDAHEYRNLYNENTIRKPSKKYILLYMLSNENDFNINRVFDFAKKKNLDVIYITGNYSADRRNKYYATIPEWLYLIDNAEYVISNSFHCAIFSILFNKQFAVVKLSGIHEGMNTRMESLFEMYQMPRRFIENNDFSVLDIPYKPEKIKLENHFLANLN